MCTFRSDGLFFPPFHIQLGIVCKVENIFLCFPLFHNANVGTAININKELGSPPEALSEVFHEL